MNSNDLLDVIGDARDVHVLDAVKTRNGTRPEKKRLSIKRAVLIAAVIALALLGRPVLGILMPFILAFTMAWMFNPIIAWLQRHLRLTRRLFSYILVLVFYALLFGLCLFFAGQLISQAIDLARSVPGFIADLQGLYNELITWLQEVLSRLPAEYASVGDEIFSLLNSAFEWLKTLLSGALGYVMSISRNVALEVPNFVIFLTVLVLASCIITADFPNLRENIYGYLGVRGKNSVRLMGHSFRAAVFGFFRSQLIFALLDMGIILAAFFIIVWEVPKGSGKIGIINANSEAGWLPVIGGQRYLLPILLVALLTGLMYIYLNYSKHGYEISVVGESERTARYVGIKVGKVIVRTMLLSGALCGIAGVLLVSGTDHTISTTIAGGRGFTAVMVSWLAKFNPISMILTSFLLVFLSRGAGEISTVFGLNQSFADILSGIIIFFIIGCEFFITYRLSFRKPAKKEEAEHV